ncbi:sigma-54-dependent Fis family transcriptional regulator [candidate division KSB1 bacterium]|nr:sigma-54-dependent Fis family transcriptional regulator [candidate division KSB1 bacterium]
MKLVLEIMLVSDDAAFLTRLKRIAGKAHISHCESISELKKHLGSAVFDIIVFAVRPGGKEQDEFKNFLKQLEQEHPQTQVLVLVDRNDIEIGIDSLSMGAFHYCRLPVSDTELSLLIDAAIKDRPHVVKTESEQDKPLLRLGPLLGQSARMQTVFEQIQQAAETDIHVLIMGETGTGKELAARAIHQFSRRRRNPFLPINLGALPRDLVASELFGHQKGAFTGASEQHIGLFERAGEGTVILDEIESIDEKVQVSLLRLIENKKFNRLGGTKTITCHARIIGVTNENLRYLIDQGLFRKDLFYRLDVFTITMPPLRENIEDIPLLIQHFISLYNRTFNKKIKRVDDAALRLLTLYEWPGNVRELKNVIQRAVLVCEADEIQSEHMPSRLRGKTAKSDKTPMSIYFDVGTPLQQVEREMIIQALRVSNNNRTEAARLLGISRRALYNKLHTHGLD